VTAGDKAAKAPNGKPKTSKATAKGPAEPPARSPSRAAKAQAPPESPAPAKAQAPPESPAPAKAPGKALAKASKPRNPGAKPSGKAAAAGQVLPRGPERTLLAAPTIPRAWDGHDLHHHGRVRVTWSRTELLHLAMGVLAITLCFALIRSPREFPEKVVDAFTDGWTLVASFTAVTTGFVLHELAHKVLAQRYGFWAEFRADVRYLLASVGLAAFAPFFFAAPGAVWIQGRPPPRQYGLISLVGPGANMLVAALALGLYWAFDPTNPDKPVSLVLGMVAVVNGFLAVFNLVPFNLPFLGGLDGLKVWRWSKVAWLVSFAAALALFVWIYLDAGVNLFSLQ
jgi:Zn-dependent protease